MTAYQKLKAENERLKRDLREVCLNPDSYLSFIIKKGYKLNRDLVREIMIGGPIINRMEYKGIIPQIK